MSCHLTNIFVIRTIIFTPFCPSIPADGDTIHVQAATTTAVDVASVMDTDITFCSCIQ